MASGFKHFSHEHNLIMHEMPDGAEVSCCGCNSSATKTIYICWQCNFYLHEQCFQAARSQKHPSHPHHPLTLVPYPTDPSNSFYCNSCELIGTGFSYSCSACDFDLHVHCAYSVSSATNSHQLNPVNGTHTHHISYPNQEVHAPIMVPAPTQYPINMTNDSYMAQNGSAFPDPTIAQNLVTSTTNHSHKPQPVTSPHQHHISYLRQEIDVPLPAQYPINVTNDSNMSSMAQNGSMFPSHTSAQNPVTSSSNFYQPQHISYPNQDRCCEPQTIPTPVPVAAQYPVATSTPNLSTFSIPTGTQNLVTAQNTCISKKITGVPTNAQNSQQSHTVESLQNKAQNLGIRHFSHPHGLMLVNKKHGKNSIACSGCEETLIGKGYACVEQNCVFQLDESCFNLDKEIQHKSHHAHPLKLLSSSPYNGNFICNGCSKEGNGFDYHCSICQHDLHVKCANLTETIYRDDHEHALKLFYECPLGEEYTFFCDVCNQVVHRDHWTYYCKKCDFGTHIDCVDRPVCDETSGDPDPVGDTRTDQQRLEEAMEVARISASARQFAIDHLI